MEALTLVIGNKNYSSWSMRPWLLLRHFGLDFEEVRIPLGQPATAGLLREWSPSLKVPVLKHGAITVWESLAICEYVSEQLLDGAGWPRDAAARALARAISSEMHAAFTELRSHWPMNCRLRRKLEPSAGVMRDLTRIEMLWNQCLERWGGGRWLFGEFSIADCMFAPVALRFHTYQPELSPRAADYVSRMLEHAPVREWMAAGQAEEEVIPEDEVGYLLGEPEWQS